MVLDGKENAYKWSGTIGFGAGSGRLFKTKRNVSPHSNGQHICPELFYKNRRHNEPENDLSFQGDLGAAVEQQNYSYSRIYAQFA